MTRQRTNLRTRSLGPVGLRPSAAAAANGVEPWIFHAATEHPFEPGGAVPRCATEDPELFWPATEAQARAARAVCLGCPLVEACRTVGRDRLEWGVWGGQLLAKGRPTTELPGNVRPARPTRPALPHSISRVAGGRRAAPPGPTRQQDLTRCAGPHQPDGERRRPTRG